MIRSFRGRQTEALYLSSKAKGFPTDIVGRARNKLAAVNAANTLDDLRVPPSNRLESLRGNRAGQHSIRINDQWRICFRWNNGDADEVEVCDYH